MPEQIVEERHEDDSYERRVIEKSSSTRHDIVTRVGQLIWLVSGVINGLIALRVILKLLAANPNNPFADFVFDVSALFLQPFFGLTATPSASNGAVLEISSLIAMFVYVLATLVITSLIYILFDDEGGGWRRRQVIRRRRREER